MSGRSCMAEDGAPSRSDPIRLWPLTPIGLGKQDRSEDAPVRFSKEYVSSPWMNVGICWSTRVPVGTAKLGSCSPFTAPSFGVVQRAHAGNSPTRPGSPKRRCVHGTPLCCFARHGRADEVTRHAGLPRLLPLRRPRWSTTPAHCRSLSGTGAHSRERWWTSQEWRWRLDRYRSLLAPSWVPSR